MVQQCKMQLRLNHVEEAEKTFEKIDTYAGLNPEVKLLSVYLSLAKGASKEAKQIVKEIVK